MASCTLWSLVTGFFLSASCSQGSVLMLIPVLHSFCCWQSIHCVNIPHFIYMFISWQVFGLFALLAFLWGVLLLETCVYKFLHRQHLFGYMPSSWTGVTILGHVVSTFSLEEPACFPEWQHHLTAYQSSSLFTCSLTFIVIPAFDDSCPRGPELVLHWGFHLHFPDGWWCWASFYIHTAHLEIFFGEVFAQILCPFLNWVVYLYHCQSPLYTLDTRPW